MDTKNQAASGKNVPITLACALYDRMQPLYTGEVKPDNIDLTFKVEDFPRKLFDSAMAQQQFDVCEMSTSDYMVRTEAGDCPFVGIPVFPSKAFRHGNIVINKKSGIRTPKDLEGRRVGVMRYTMTAAVWIRGHLQNDYGVDLSKIDWVEGSINSPGSHGVPTIIPEGVRCTVNTSNKSLSDMLEAGEIDATIGTHLPDARFTNPDIVRLIPDFREVEKQYFKTRGIFPIMHFIAIKRGVYEANPSIAKDLFNAFQASKRAALTRARNYSALRYMLPFLDDHLDEVRETFGDDPWTYGLEPNRATLEEMMKFMVQQGMLKAPIKLEKLFLPVE